MSSDKARAHWSKVLGGKAQQAFTLRSQLLRLEGEIWLLKKLIEDGVLEYKEEGEEHADETKTS